MRQRINGMNKCLSQDLTPLEDNSSTSGFKQFISHQASVIFQVPELNTTTSASNRKQQSMQNER